MLRIVLKLYTETVLFACLNILLKGTQVKQMSQTFHHIFLVHDQNIF